MSKNQELTEPSDLSTILRSDISALDPSLGRLPSQVLGDGVDIQIDHHESTPIPPGLKPLGPSGKGSDIGAGRQLAGDHSGLPNEQSKEVPSQALEGDKGSSLIIGPCLPSQI